MPDEDTKQAAISVSLPSKLLKQINDRARELNIPRSRYLAWLAQGDVAKGGQLTIAPITAANPAPTAAPLPSHASALEDFLFYAIPALEDFINNPDADCEPPENATDAELWQIFFADRQEIRDLKWIESKKAGCDIGWRAAIHIWVEKHRPVWIAEYRRKHPAP